MQKPHSQATRSTRNDHAANTTHDQTSNQTHATRDRKRQHQQHIHTHQRVHTVNAHTAKGKTSG